MPDYERLIQFLVAPFLELPNSLRVDCERSTTSAKVWIRVAFEGSDKGRVFGRGGRNIQAIRIVLSGVAHAAGESVHLDIYGSQTAREGSESDSPPDRPSGSRRPSGPRGGGRPPRRHGNS